jgi:homoserine O-acetyltransferase
MSSQSLSCSAARSTDIDAPLQRIDLGAFTLESGEVVEDCAVAWVEHGLQSTDAPVALVLSAIGSTHQRLEFLIGPGLPLDTRRLRILAVNALGNGLSASPSNAQRQHGHAFPRFTIRDMVRSQKCLLDRLGVSRLDLVAGASMGGMQALQWGVSYPDRMDRIVALSPLARTPGWSAAINAAARQALAPLVRSAMWPRTRYTADDWQPWVLIMQALALRSPDRINAEVADAQALPGWLRAQAETWAAQGRDPLDWIYQSWAYDAHDVGTTPGFGGDTAAALASIRAATLVVGASLDLYNPVAGARWAAEQIPRSVYAEVQSTWGHLAFSAADRPHLTSIRRQLSQFLWGTAEHSTS